MTVVRELLAELGLDTRPFEKGVTSATGLAMGFNTTLSQMSMLGSRILYGSLALAASGLTLLGTGLYQGIQAAAQAEEVEAQLNAVLASTGMIAGVTAEDVKNLSSELAGLTKFEDEAITSAQNLLLTFTSISEDVFPETTEIVLDMSQALGQDLKASAVQVGKALQDPIEGVTALRRVGVNFSDVQQEMIKKLVESGDLLEAQKFILAELQKEFGGSAKAAGATFAGQITILKNRIGDLLEEALKPTLPILLDMAKRINEWLVRPETITMIQMLALTIANFVSWIITHLPLAFNWLQQTFGWFQQNQGVVVAALAAIGSTLIALIWTVVIPAALAWIAAWGPVILVIGLVALAAYLLYQAWVNNLWGIQQFSKKVIAFLLDAFFRLRAHLAIFLPKALEFFRKIWEERLLPTLQKGAKWIGDTFMPLITALSSLFSTVFRISLTIVAGILTRYIIPAFSSFITLLSRYAVPIIVALARFLAVSFVQGIINLGKAIDWLVIRIEWLNRRLNALSIPSWLTPGSPTPLETGILGIVDATNKLARTSLPMFSTQNPDSFAGSNQGVSRTINLRINAEDLTLEKVIELLDNRDEQLFDAITQAVT